MKRASLLREASVPAAGRRAGAFLLLCGLGLAALSAAAVIPGSGVASGHVDWLDLLSFLAVGPTALSCLVRAAAIRPERMPWALIGVALLLYCVANAYSVLAPQQIAAVRGWDWALWLTWYPLLAVALVRLLRSRVGGVPRSLWLDSVVVGCAVGAAYTALLTDAYLRDLFSAPVENPGITIAVAYPVGDLVLLALVTSVLVVHGWRPPRSWGWLLAALVAAAVGDGAELSGLVSARVAASLWPLAAVMFAWAAWLPAPRLDKINVIGRRMFLAPVFCSLVVLTVLLYGAGSGIGPAVALAATSFLGLLVRVWLLFDDVRRASLALEQAHAVAERLSRVDPLTGTANRRAFGEALNQVSAEDAGTGILLVDIDHFKRINDGYGHDAGDTVIVEVTRRISATVRRTDVVGRWGGEEFCVLLHAVPGSYEVEIIAEKIRADVNAEPIILPDGQLIDLTVSVGAIFLEHVTTLTVAMNAADQQLYAAKRGGRNQVRSAAPVAAAIPA